MGTRRKIPIQKRETKEKISVAFSKRRVGLFSKAADLCVLGGARMAILLTSPGSDANFYSFGYPSADAVVDAFLENRVPLAIDEESKPSVFSAYHAAKDLKRDRQREYVNSMGNNKKSKKRKRESGFWWEEEDFDQYQTVDELRSAIDRLQKLKNDVVMTLNKRNSSDHDGSPKDSDQDFNENLGNVLLDGSQAIVDPINLIPGSIEINTQKNDALIASDDSKQGHSVWGNAIVTMNQTALDSGLHYDEDFSVEDLAISMDDLRSYFEIDPTVDFSFLEDMNLDDNQRKEKPPLMSSTDGGHGIVSPGFCWEEQDFDQYQAVDELRSATDRLQKRKSNVVMTLNERNSSDQYVSFKDSGQDFNENFGGVFLDGFPAIDDPINLTSSSIEVNTQKKETLVALDDSKQVQSVWNNAIVMNQTGLESGLHYDDDLTISLDDFGSYTEINPTVDFSFLEVMDLDDNQRKGNSPLMSSTDGSNGTVSPVDFNYRDRNVTKFGESPQHVDFDYRDENVAKLRETPHPDEWIDFFVAKYMRD